MHRTQYDAYVNTFPSRRIRGWKYAIRTRKPSSQLTAFSTSMQIAKCFFCQSFSLYGFQKERSFQNNRSKFLSRCKKQGKGEEREIPPTSFQVTPMACMVNKVFPNRRCRHLVTHGNLARLCLEINNATRLTIPRTSHVRRTINRATETTSNHESRHLVKRPHSLTRRGLAFSTWHHQQTRFFPLHTGTGIIQAVRAIPRQC